jgi:hypothetical protein
MLYFRMLLRSLLLPVRRPLRSARDAEIRAYAAVDL